MGVKKARDAMRNMFTKMGALMVVTALLSVGTANASVQEEETLPAEAGAIDAETLDLCFLGRPEPYLIRFCTNAACSTYTDITEFDSNGEGTFYICAYQIPANVQGVKTYWKTGAGVCDYCEADDWTAEYKYSSGWNYDDEQSCFYYGGFIHYYGYEYSYYTNKNFGYEYISRFDRDGTGTDSMVYSAYCDEQ